MLPRVVVRQVVDPVRDGLPQYKRKLQRSSARPFPSETAYSVAVGVMKQVDFRSEDRLRFPPPSLAWVLARTDQLLLLGIDANHRQAGTYVKPPQAGQRAELRSRSGSLTSASCLRLVRSEKPASCNTRAMVFADTLIPCARRALASFRVERCVHSKPVMGSPAVASASKLPKALKTPGWWSRSVYGQRDMSNCRPREQGGFLGQPQLKLETGVTRLLVPLAPVRAMPLSASGSRFERLTACRVRHTPGYPPRLDTGQALRGGDDSSTVSRSVRGSSSRFVHSFHHRSGRRFLRRLTRRSSTGNLWQIIGRNVSALQRDHVRVIGQLSNAKVGVHDDVDRTRDSCDTSRTSSPWFLRRT